MKTIDEAAESAESELQSRPEDDLLLQLIERPAASHAETPSSAVVVGTLVATTGGGVPLVVFPGQTGTAAIAARTTIDLHALHIGKEVVLAFEGGDRTKPIVVGALRGDREWPGTRPTANVEIVADHERIIVSAAEQLVLRCGDASITLTKAGKVLIKGAYVSSDSAGVLRLRGGSIQLN
jgi:hypothetical protein